MTKSSNRFRKTFFQEYTLKLREKYSRKKTYKISGNIVRNSRSAISLLSISAARWTMYVTVCRCDRHDRSSMRNAVCVVLSQGFSCCVLFNRQMNIFITIDTLPVVYLPYGFLINHVLCEIHHIAI